MRTSEQIFEEELSGEPLTRESVIETLTVIQEELLKDIDQYIFNELGNSPEYYAIYYGYTEPKLWELNEKSS